MLERLTASDFVPLIGAEFRLSVPGEADSQPIRLQSAAVLGDARQPGMREPFALHFLGAGTAALPQAIYRLESETLGPIEIFLVPIGRDANGVTYEAIFS